MADLGCSSGDNTFLAMSEIVNTVITTYQQKGQNPPEIECCLNDLPDNDFNTTFSLIPSFHEKLKMDVKEKCFVSGVPGSFYSRLFSSNSLHFVHSSFSLHWLSKVPDGLEENKKNVYLRSPCPPNVYKSYLNQFKNDFSLFLRMRAEETVAKGRMALTLVGRKSLDPLSKDCFQNWSLISDSLYNLVSEVLIVITCFLFFPPFIFAIVNIHTIKFFFWSAKLKKMITWKTLTFFYNRFKILAFKTFTIANNA